jgi:hypothetical protein
MSDLEKRFAALEERVEKLEGRNNDFEGLRQRIQDLANDHGFFIRKADEHEKKLAELGKIKKASPPTA